MEKNSSQETVDGGTKGSPPGGGIFSTCVEGIREGLRKINVCKDVDREEIVQPCKKEPLTNEECIKFDEYLDSLPLLESSQRIKQWMSKSSYSQSTKIPLDDLPMRGTLLPTRYEPGNEIIHDDIDTQTSVSLYEAARGTHGRGTPPKLDHTQPRLDEIFNQLQQGLEKEARRKLIEAGEKHLLSYNLMDVYSHQVPGLPLGVTPDVIPFMSHHKHSSTTKLQRNCHHIQQVHFASSDYVCYWSNCQKRFTSTKDLFTHIEEKHLPICSVGRLTCRWKNCNKTFSVRYKLVIHIHQTHCKESVDRKV